MKVLPWKDTSKWKVIGQRSMIPLVIHMNDSTLWKTYERAIKPSFNLEKQTRTDGAIHCGSFVLRSHLKWKRSGQRFMTPFVIDMNDSILWKCYPRATQRSLNDDKRTITDRVINCGSFILLSHLKWKGIWKHSMILWLINSNDSNLWKDYPRATQRSLNHEKQTTTDWAINCESFALRLHFKWKVIGQCSIIPWLIEFNDRTLSKSYARATNLFLNYKKRSTTDTTINCGFVCGTHTGLC